MAIDPKKELKRVIDELTDEEAQGLLNKIQDQSDVEFVSFEEISPDYEEIVDRFEEAFQELAK